MIPKEGPQPESKEREQRLQNVQVKLRSLCLEQRAEDERSGLLIHPAATVNEIEGIYFTSPLYQKRIDQTHTYLSDIQSSEEREGLVKRCVGAVFADVSWHTVRATVDPSLIVLSYDRTLALYKTMFPDNEEHVFPYDNTLHDISVPRTVVVKVDETTHTDTIVGVYECTTNIKPHKITPKAKRHIQTKEVYPELFAKQVHSTVIMPEDSKLAQRYKPEEGLSVVFEKTPFMFEDIREIVSGIMEQNETIVIKANPESMQSYLRALLTETADKIPKFTSKDEALAYCLSFGDDFLSLVYDRAYALFSKSIAPEFAEKRYNHLQGIFYESLVYFVYQQIDNVHKNRMILPTDKTERLWVQVYADRPDAINDFGKVYKPGVVVPDLLDVQLQEGIGVKVRKTLEVSTNKIPLVHKVRGKIRNVARSFLQNRELYDATEEPVLLFVVPTQDSRDAMVRILDVVGTERPVRRGKKQIIKSYVGNTEVFVAVELLTIPVPRETLYQLVEKLYKTYRPGNDSHKPTLEELSKTTES